MNPSIFILTGAGISAESGISTFRDEDGLWMKHRIEDVATPEAFERDPLLVQKFYNERRSALSAVAPNEAHHALARLQREYSGSVTLVTQNIDNLHERAGADVIHMHGELAKARCGNCEAVHPYLIDIAADAVCTQCKSEGMLRPHVVWFGEMPLFIDQIEKALMSADIFAAIGTSGEVYPAAGYADVARVAGAKTIELNLQVTDAGRFDELITGPASSTVPVWVEDILANR